VYSFAAAATDWTKRAVPREVLEELLLDATLGAFWGIDVQRPYLPFVGATDSSSAYGHGAAVAPMPVEQVRLLGRLCVKAGDRVLFGKYSGQAVKMDGKELLVMREDDILAIVG
jgi:co-chaperonin GroES (HSP10)